MKVCTTCMRYIPEGKKCDCYKIAKKIIKFRTLSNNIFKLDKIFKYIKVDITKLNYINNCENGVVCEVTYKKGVKLWNPITWCIFIVFFIMLLIQSICENTCDIIKAFSLEEYVETVKLKNKEY